jgi:hypothetical protein
MFSGLPDLLLGHADGLGHEGAVVHLAIVAHLGSFIIEFDNVDQRTTSMTR